MHNAPQKVDTPRVITLKPGESQAVRIGIFESTMPTPRLAVDSTPHLGEQLGVSVTRLDEDGDYTLICHIQNFSDHPADVTIRSTE